MKRLLPALTKGVMTVVALYASAGLSGRAAAQGCTAPGLSSFPIGSDRIVSGQTYSISWSDAPGLGIFGVYFLEGSRSPDFAPLVFRYKTANPALSFSTVPAGADFTLYLRVKAVQQCGAVGPVSATLAVLEGAAPARAVFTASGPGWVVPLGSTPPSTNVTVRNIGGLAGDVTFTAKDAFFTVDPPVLTLQSGAFGTVRLTPLASAVAEAGFHYTRLLAKTGSQTVATPVTLSVTTNPSGDLSGLTVRASTSRVVFVAPGDRSPAPQIVELTLSAPVPGVRLAARIGPGGTWLGLNPAELTRPIDATGKTALTLSVDRSQRTLADGASPLRTLLRIHPAGAPNDLAHSTIIEVIDSDAPPVTANAGSSRPSSGKSFIIPSAVKAVGQAGAVFFSDGWVRNLAPRSVDASLFYTPEGKDGTVDPSVLKTSFTMSPGAMVRVSDLLGSIFGTSGTGLIDLRTVTPQALTVRSTVESVTGGDPTSRYGTELPVVGRGTGTGVGEPELVLPGISDDATNRANLILAETSGASVTVEATLYAPDGALLGSLSRTVPAYSKLQLNRIGQTLAQGAAVSGGSLAVRATAGAGRVFPLATVIDNRSNSFSAIRGRAVRATSLNATLSPLAEAEAPGLLIPSAVRLTGAFNTQYTTTMAMVNGTAQPAAMTMTYHYIDVASGGTAKSVTKTWTIAPRGALDKVVGDDVIAKLFGITTPSYGWMGMAGDTDRVVAVAGISAAVEPNDPSKGVKTAQVDGLTTDSPNLIAIGDADHRFTGAEKSDAKRTNLILVETTGVPSEVLVRVYTATGDAMAQRSFPVNGGAYVQINDVFGDAGVGLGDGPFQNVEVTAEVTSGAGRVIALATVVDNVSRNPEIFVLQPPGVSSPSIGF